MQKALLVVLFMICAFSFTAQAQLVDGVPLTEIESTYVQLIPRGRLFVSKIRVRVDLGQDLTKVNINESMISDENGRVVDFNSMVDVLNYFDQLGYEYIGSENFNEGSSIQYTLRRKRNGLDLANSPKKDPATL